MRGAAAGGGKYLAGAAGLGAVAGMRQLASAVPGGSMGVTGLAGLAAATMKGGLSGGGGRSGGGTGAGGTASGKGGIPELLVGQLNIVKVLNRIHKDTTSIRKAVDDMRSLAYEDARKRLKEIKKPKIAGLLAGPASSKVTSAEGAGGIPLWMLGGMAGLAALQGLMNALSGAAGWIGATLIAKPWNALKGFFGKGGTLARLGASLGGMTSKGLAGIKNFFLGKSSLGGRTGGVLSQVGNALSKIKTTGLAKIGAFFGPKGPLARVGNYLDDLIKGALKTLGLGPKAAGLMAARNYGPKGQRSVRTAGLRTPSMAAFDKAADPAKRGAAIRQTAAGFNQAADPARTAAAGRQTARRGTQIQKSMAGYNQASNAPRPVSGPVKPQRSAVARNYGADGQKPVKTSPVPKASPIGRPNAFSNVLKSGTASMGAGGKAFVDRAKAKGVNVAGKVAGGLARFFATSAGKVFLKFFKIIMKAVPVIGAALLVYEAITILARDPSEPGGSLEDKTNAIGSLLGATVGTVVGIKIGAMLGTVGGPLGILAGMAIGGVAFYFGGEWLGRKIARIIMGFNDQLTAAEKAKAEEMIAGQQQSLATGMAAMTDWKSVVDVMGADSAISATASTDTLQEVGNKDLTQEQAVEMVGSRLALQQRMVGIAQSVAARTKDGTLPGTMLGEDAIAAAGERGQIDSTGFKDIRTALSKSFAGEQDMTDQERHDFQVANNLMIAQNPASKAGPKKRATEWLKNNAKLDAQGKSIAEISGNGGKTEGTTYIANDAAAEAARQGGPPGTSTQNIDAKTITVNGGGGEGNGVVVAPAAAPDVFIPKSDHSMYGIYS